MDLWRPQTDEARQLRLALWGLCLDAITANKMRLAFADLSDWCRLRAAVTEEEGRRLLAEAARARAIIGTGQSPLPAADLCPCDDCGRERRWAVFEARHHALDLLLLKQCQPSERAEALAQATLTYSRAYERVQRAQDCA